MCTISSSPARGRRSGRPRTAGAGRCRRSARARPLSGRVVVAAAVACWIIDAEAVRRGRYRPGRVTGAYYLRKDAALAAARSRRHRCRHRHRRPACLHYCALCYRSCSIVNLFTAVLNIYMIHHQPWRHWPGNCPAVKARQLPLPGRSAGLGSDPHDKLVVPRCVIDSSTDR